MRALRTILTGLALLGGCCGPSQGLAGPRTTVRILPGASEPLILVPEDPAHESIECAQDGGLYALPPGAWQLRAATPGSSFLPRAVPAWFPGETSADDADLVLDPTPAMPGDEEFATIPAGPALIGDRLGVGKPDERPARILDVDAFQLGRTEITNAQYVEFLNDALREAPPEQLDALLDLRSRKCRIEQLDDGFETDAEQLPVVTITWSGARAYCAWRTQRDGRTHRLPSEVEWEKAARGPGSFVFSYGNVYTPDAANQASGRLMEVAQFEPNGFGLHDMTGNAFEWTNDLRTKTDSHPETRYLRGGSFVLDGIFLRNSFRMFLRPTVRADDVGFRVLREL